VGSNDEITVVIPCFNLGRFLGEAVESALGQSGGPPRVVVVDAGSTDEATPAALEALPDGVEVLRRESPGPATTRNAGAAATDTPLLLNLDADDRLAPGALEGLRGGLAHDPEAGFSYGVMRMFGSQEGQVRFPDYDPYRLLYRPIIGGPGTMLIRREVFDAVGGFDPEVPGYEDWDLQLSALERGWHGRRVPQVTLEYRRHGPSGLAGDRAKHREIMRALRAKHAELYARAGELGRQSDLGPAGRLAYRTWWAWRPLPARLEQALYGLRFRQSR
jgi:glycosyltransferase involved in cell wall biosynthesis